eukprot:740028_1
MVYLYGNMLSGPIPPELGNIRWLKYLYLYENELSGTIPPELGDLGLLDCLGLENNNLSGNIPPEIADLRLIQLRLANNELSGTIPRQLGFHTRRTRDELTLAGNKFCCPVVDYSRFVDDNDYEELGCIQCKEAILGCDDKPCMNGGQCTNSGETGDYKCECADGYEGENCAKKILGCAVKPCQNGGQCTNSDEADSYKCECAAGYEGENCEKNKSTALSWVIGVIAIIVLVIGGYAAYSC